MNCNRIRAFLGPWLDGELDARSLVEVEQHLESCSGCRRRFASEQRFEDRLADELRDERLPEAAWSRLLEATRPRVPRATARRWLALAAAALIVIAVAVGWPPATGPTPLFGALAASHRRAEVGASSLELVSTDAAPIRAWLAERGVADWGPPAGGELAGHPVSLLGARTEHVDSAPALMVELTCCGRPASLFVMGADAVGRLDAQDVETLASEGVVRHRVGELHATSWMQAGQFVTLVSSHALPVEALRS